MKILLLGGTGFIGLHLLEKLSDASDLSVKVYSRHPLKHNLLGREVEYIIGDLLDTDRLFEAIKNTDVLVHLASSTVPATAERNPKYDIKMNLAASVGLFELIPRTSVKRIIFLSSGGTVYGNPQYLPVDESHPLNPIGSYGIVKVAIEYYLKNYANKYNFDYTILRVSNPYGPRQRVDGLQGVIATFLHRVAQGRKIQIWGSGETLRDYIYVEDLAVCLQKLIHLDELSGTFNIGSGTGHSLTDIIEVIRQATGITPEISFTPALSGSVDSTYLNINKIQREAQWSPNTSLYEGVKKYYDWYKAVGIFTHNYVGD